MKFPTRPTIRVGAITTAAAALIFGSVGIAHADQRAQAERLSTISASSEQLATLLPAISDAQAAAVKAHEKADAADGKVLTKASRDALQSAAVTLERHAAAAKKRAGALRAQIAVAQQDRDASLPSGKRATRAASQLVAEADAIPALTVAVDNDVAAWKAAEAEKAAAAKAAEAKAAADAAAREAEASTARSARQAAPSAPASTAASQAAAAPAPAVPSAPAPSYSTYSVSVRADIGGDSATKQAAVDAGGVVNLNYGTFSIFASHNVNNAVALKLQVGDHLVVTGVHAGTYRVTGSMDFVSGSWADMTALGGTQMIQTCYWGTGTTRVVGLALI